MLLFFLLQDFRQVCAKIISQSCFVLFTRAVLFQQPTRYYKLHGPTCSFVGFVLASIKSFTFFRTFSFYYLSIQQIHNNDFLDLRAQWLPSHHAQVSSSYQYVQYSFKLHNSFCTLVNLNRLIILLYEKVILFDLPYITVNNYQFRLSKYDLVKNKMSAKQNTFAFLF